MTSRQYGKRAIFFSGDVRFQDGDAVDLGKLGGGRSLLSSFSIFQCMQYALLYVAITYTHSTTLFIMVQWPVRHLGIFYVCQCAWRIVPIIFNNVSLCPLIFHTK